jgi:hypothetical protein
MRLSLYPLPLLCYASTEPQIEKEGNQAKWPPSGSPSALIPSLCHANKEAQTSNECATRRARKPTYHFQVHFFAAGDIF